MIHEVARSGFTVAAGAYEVGRPSYPSEVVDLAGAGPGTTVIDVGAGTGKLTAQLCARGGRVVAVEPLPAMRARISSGVVAAGTAEALPLRAGCAHGVTVAQAFHWFDAGAALAEAARVLRPGGVLLLVWNERDQAFPWVFELDAIFDWDTCRPYRRGIDWAAVVEQSGRFGACRHRQLRWSQELDADTLVARVLSTSYVAMWPQARQDAVVGQVRELVADFGATFELPYVTDVYWCTTPS